MSRLTQQVQDVADPAVRERVFTPLQAQRSLVLIRRIVADIVTEFRYLLDQQEVTEQAAFARCQSVQAKAQEQVRRAFGRLESCREELGDIGVELKDWLRGVVHFPCVMDGRGAWLCWRYDEPRVGHWHYAETSCADRQSLAHRPGTYAPGTSDVHEAVQSARRVV